MPLGRGGGLVHGGAHGQTLPARQPRHIERRLGALSQMTQKRIRHLPVVHGGKMVGFVSIGDLVKYRIDKIEAEAAAMRDYIAS